MEAIIRRLILIASVLCVALSSVHSRAAELLMFEEEWCHWCERWNAEIGVIYDKTTEAKQAPLRRLDIHDRLPTDFKLKTRVQFTPTFVLIENGQEVGRIEGYPGEDFFWGLLGRLLERLPAPAPQRPPNEQAALGN